jgi:hypothetical protein
VWAHGLVRRLWLWRVRRAGAENAPQPAAPGPQGAGG